MSSLLRSSPEMTNDGPMRVMSMGWQQKEQYTAYPLVVSRRSLVVSLQWSLAGPKTED